MVDGCGRARAIVQIIMPISLAGILSAVIFAFTLTIKEFTYALPLITSSSTASSRASWARSSSGTKASEEWTSGALAARHPAAT